MFMQDTSYHTTIESAWRNYIASGTLNKQVIKDTIGQSWDRCQREKVNPHDGVCQNILTSHEINLLHEKNKEFISIARPFMKDLYAMVKGSGYIFVLSDGQGHIIESFGDSETVYDAKKINFISGANWTEKEVGTNAIGTTLKIKHPIQITGPEHFCKMHHSWTCSSAPILDQNGDIIGVFDISGPAKYAHPHTLGMVVSITNAIRNNYLIHLKNQEMKKINKKWNNLFNLTSDGLFELDNNYKIKKINKTAIDILGMEEHDIIGHSILDLFDGSMEGSMLHNNKTDEICFKLRNISKEDHYYIASQLLKDSEQMNSGYLVILKKSPDASNKYIYPKPQRNIKSEVDNFMDKIVGQSTLIKETKELITMASSSGANVLLTGESGTGKELFAQAIHKLGKGKGPFVAFNCGAYTSEIIYSELFGYEGGAFTGAKKEGKMGKFEAARGGTLFLDEIGDLPKDQQPVLLRAIQNKKITRLGSNDEIPVDIRLICATNKNLLHEVEQGNFRLDLYHRLNVININIPPLRDRPEDIPILFNHFIEQACRKNHRKYKFSSEVYKPLLEYHWPGNVRELENLVEKITNLSCDGIINEGVIYRELESRMQKVKLIEKTDLMEFDRTHVKHVADNIEKQEILKALLKNKGNITKTAIDLDVSRNTLYRKMKYHSIK